jgi:hypothetical protein
MLDAHAIVLATLLVNWIPVLNIAFRQYIVIVCLALITAIYGVTAVVAHMTHATHATEQVTGHVHVRTQGFILYTYKYMLLYVTISFTHRT